MICGKCTPMAEVRQARQVLPLVPSSIASGRAAVGAHVCDAGRGDGVLILGEPVEGEQAEVFEIDYAVAVDVAGDDGFAGWLAKV